MFPKRDREERWVQLRAALRQPVNHLVLLNPFLPSSQHEELLRQRHLEPHPVVPLVFTAKGDVQGEEDPLGSWGAGGLSPGPENRQHPESGSLEVHVFWGHREL